MKIAIGSDHAAFDLKKSLITLVGQLGHEIIDIGTRNRDPVDYPDFAEKVAKLVATGDADRGIMLCGSGIGACIACNKVKGIRAGICHDTYSAHQGVEHDSMNVLVIGARVIGAALAEDVVASFLAAKFSDEKRHVRRLAKIALLEDNFGT